MTVYPPRPSAPATRVRVTSEESSAPRPIAPPAQVEEEGRRAASPPLPSHKSRMDEHENPFKPQDILYHEVDPIVEQYLHKPFPPSQPGSAAATPVKHSNGHAHIEEIQTRLTHSSAMTAPPVPQPVESQSPAYYQNGLSRSDLITDEKLLNESSQPLIAPHRRSESEQPLEPLPPPENVEIVHIKKKKCGCCSLQ